MILFCDDLGAATALLPSARASSADGSEPWTRELWDALGGGAASHVACADDTYWRAGVIVREAASSQFDALRTLLAGGAAPPGPLFALALAGRGFHGQRGRAWAVAYGNLHLCAALAPIGLPAAEALALPMLPAVAAIDAVAAVSGGAVRPGIKWVNDIVLDGGKLGGVLAASQSFRGDLVWAVVGIGLNVTTTPAVPLTRSVPAVDCLARHLPGITLRAVLAALLGALAARARELAREGPAPLLAAYRAASVVIGRTVSVYAEDTDEAYASPTNGAVARGVVTAVNPDLSLTLAGGDEPLRAGRLILEE